MRSNKNYLKKISLLLCLAFILITINVYSKNVNATTIYNKPHFQVKIDSIVPNPSKVGEDITVSGTITPDDFENIIQKKQVVLVIDTSGSMADPKTWNKNDSKIEKLKVAAKNFVTKMGTISNMEIAIVAFSDKGIINPNLSGYSDGFVSLNSSNVANSSNITLVNNSIDKLSADGATNTGDGLRNAAYLLSKSNDAGSVKTIVFMSDGQPTKYEIYNSKSWVPGTYTGYYVSDSSGNKYAWDGQNLPPGYSWGSWHGYKYISDSSGNKYTAFDRNNVPNNYTWRYDWSMGNYLRDSSYYNYILDGYNLPPGYKWGYGQFTGYKYDYNYYTDINSYVIDSNVSIVGPGNSDDNDGNCLKYAETIGKIIKDKGYNVFSIGYGLDSSSGDDAKMRAIHNSMSDNPNNYYATGTDAINGAYNTIADKIINSYTVNNITMNLNLGTDFKLNYGSNVVNIQNVTYTKKTGETDRIVYHADPIPFQFTIKGSKTVTDYNIFQGATLVVPWNGEQLIDTNMPEAKVTIEENDLPKINVNLSKINDQTVDSNQNPLVMPGQPIKVTYQINTDPFEYNINNSIGGNIDDAVFVVDLSKDMTLDERWGVIKNEFTNAILKGDILTGQNIKLGVVGYNNSVINPIETGSYNRLFNRNNDSENEKLRLLLQDESIDTHEFVYPDANKEDRNIGPALKKADQLLQQYAGISENKAIVLVNSGDVKYSPEDIAAIKNKGYKIISLDMSCIKNQPTPTSNLHKLHSDLNGNDKEYFISTRDTNGAGNFNNDNYEMIQIANCLKGGTSPKELIVSGAKLNFDLGENFETDSNSGLEGNGNIRTVTLPDIKYTLVKDDQGKYKWTQNAPNPREVSFYVQTVPGKIGELGFANDTANDPPEALKNYVSYTKFDGILTKKHIDTPVVTVSGEAVPNITAQAVNPPNSAGIFNEMLLEYKITAKSFPDNLIPGNLEKQDTYSFITTLKFHTGSKFQGSSGFKLDNNDPWYDLETVPFQVNYKLVDHTYVADPVSNIALTIKPKLNGNLTFGNIEDEDDDNKKFPGAVSYTDLLSKQVLNKIAPFNINVSQKVDYGLYQGINDGELSVISNSVELPRGTIANLAMGTHIASSDTTITLQVNNKVDIISGSSPIKIYKIINDNGQWKLTELSGASYSGPTIDGDYNNYSISLPSGINTETKLVIMYQSRIPTDDSILGPFVNKSIVNGIPYDFTLNISNQELPDLF